MKKGTKKVTKKEVADPKTKIQPHKMSGYNWALAAIIPSLFLGAGCSLYSMWFCAAYSFGCAALIGFVVMKKLQSGDTVQKTAPKYTDCSLLKQKVIVRANVAGVHAGIVTHFDPANQTVTLKNAYRMWRFYTRDTSGSISDVAANGLKPDGAHSIGAKLPSVTIVNPPGLELAEMTDAAYRTLEQWKNK